MLIKSKDAVVSFSFQPEDAVALTRFPALSGRVQPGLFELIQSALPESVALSTGLLPALDAASRPATSVDDVPLLGDTSQAE